MKIIIIAAVAVVLTVGIFYMLDRRDKAGSSTAARQEDARAASPPPGEKKEGLIDYSVYVMTPAEKSMYIVIAAAALFVVGYIFYQNLIISLLLSALGLFFPRIRTQQLINKRKDKLSIQFKQALQSLASSLSAGRSVENAFAAVADDLKMLFSDPNTYIIREFETINIRVANGEPIEKALEDFRQRADIEDISNFVDVFVVCKRTGGNLADVIRRTSGIIGEKLQVQQDLQVLMAQKRFEARILMVAPVLMVGLLNWSSPDYMAPLYEFGPGPLVMTGALLVIGFAVWLTNWIMNIKV